MARRQPARLHGILVIDKPAGLTSHDVVTRVRRLTGERRVGHGGTLDPFATGVLPLCVGQATRLVEYLSNADKRYLAEVVLGVQTDTDDLEGSIIRTAPVPTLERAAMDRALDAFRGPIQQTPPAYAAIKIGGRKLYELARAGEPVVATARPVTIHRLEIVDWRPPALTLLVDCGKGTYIRSLARDIGHHLGSAGYVQHLRRAWSGPFGLADAWPLAELEADWDPMRWPLVALHPEAILLDQPALALTTEAVRTWRHGMAVSGPAADDDVLARVYGADGAFLGVGLHEAEARLWRPEKVLHLDDDQGL